MRVGVALCDPDGILATPLETIPQGDECVPRLVALTHEHDVIEGYRPHPD